MHGPEVFFSLQMLQNLLNTIGYPAITLIILIESAGIPLPGETILLLASFYAATHPEMQLPIVIACAALGAILGDNLGYYAGRTGGRRLVERFGRYLFVKPEHLAKAERFFARHGAKAVFFGRFISLLRMWAAFLAGVNGMRWRTFMLYNAAGGILWATYVGLLGYFAGSVFQQHFDQVVHLVRMLGWASLGLVLLGAALAFVLVRLRRRYRAAASTEDEDVKANKTPVSIPS